jgi:hypothetical protein
MEHSRSKLPSDYVILQRNKETKKQREKERKRERKTQDRRLYEFDFIPTLLSKLISKFWADNR